MEQYCVSDVDVTLIRVYSPEHGGHNSGEGRKKRRKGRERRENRCRGLCNKKKKSSSSGDRQIRMKKETLETTRWREAERHREREAERRTGNESTYG